MGTRVLCAWCGNNIWGGGRVNNVSKTNGSVSALCLLCMSSSLSVRRSWFIRKNLSRAITVCHPNGTLLKVPLFSVWLHLPVMPYLSQAKSLCRSSQSNMMVIAPLIFCIKAQTTTIMLWPSSLYSFTTQYTPCSPSCAAVEEHFQWLVWPGKAQRGSLLVWAQQKNHTVCSGGEHKGLSVCSSCPSTHPKDPVTLRLWQAWRVCGGSNAPHFYVPASASDPTSRRVRREEEPFITGASECQQCIRHLHHKGRVTWQWRTHSHAYTRNTGRVFVWCVLRE